jgi:hypothetical protein
MMNPMSIPTSIELYVPIAIETFSAQLSLDPERRYPLQSSLRNSFPFLCLVPVPEGEPGQSLSPP